MSSDSVPKNMFQNETGGGKSIQTSQMNNISALSQSHCRHLQL